MNMMLRILKNGQMCFHNNAKPPLLPSQSTAMPFKKPKLIFFESKKVTDTLVSWRKTRSGSSFFSRSQRDQTPRGLPKPWVFQLTIIIVIGGVSLQLPPNRLYWHGVSLQRRQPLPISVLHCSPLPHPQFVAHISVQDQGKVSVCSREGQFL